MISTNEDGRPVESSLPLIKKHFHVNLSCGEVESFGEDWVYYFRLQRMELDQFR